MQTLPKKSTRIGLFAGLCWLYTCIHLDRQILAILAQSVKSDLALSDASLGALTGSAFSIVYALLGLHFGRVADVADRLAMVRIGAWIWSLSSIGSAFAPGYAVMVAGRGGVAAGEAIATAAAVSLMTELAGERYRARASSLFFACAFLGAGLAAVLGGAVVEHYRHAGGGGWRAGLLIAGCPGIVGALYLGAYRWRDRRRTEQVPAGTGAGVTLILVAASVLAVWAQVFLPTNQGVLAAVLLAGAAGVVWAHRLRRDAAVSFHASLGQPAFRWLLVAFAAVLFMDFAASFWLFPFAQRHFGVSAATVGTQLGGLMIVGGIGGCAMGGWLADRWRLVSAAGRVWTAFAAALVEAAAILVALTRSEYLAFVAAFSLFCLASGGWTGVAAAIGMDIVPRAHRGTGVAVYFLVTTVLGPGLGAWAAGVLGDALGSVSRSLSVCCAAVVIAAVGFIRLGGIVNRGSAARAGAGPSA